MNEITHYLPGIALSMSAVSLALLSPGPNVLAVIGTSMSIGRSHGAALASGVALGSFIWASVAVLGLTALLTAYAGLLSIIKIVGGCYLIWLGYKSLKSALSPRLVSTDTQSTIQHRKTFFLRGLTVQMTNPKAALAMTAIVTIGLPADAPLWVNVALVIGISSLSLIGHLMYAFAFSTQTIVEMYFKTRCWVEGAMGVFFCFAGVKLLTDKST